MESNERKLIDVRQGSNEWLDLVKGTYGASEAGIVMGLSPYKKRHELLVEKATGFKKPVSKWVQDNVFKLGHRVEALARKIVEDKFNTTLFPITATKGNLRASLDGIDSDYLMAFEHKQYSKKLFPVVQEGIIPEYHMAQCQQIMYITDCEEVLFVCSDGTMKRFSFAWAERDDVFIDMIIEAWEIFDKDVNKLRNDLKDDFNES